MSEQPDAPIDTEPSRPSKRRSRVLLIVAAFVVVAVGAVSAVLFWPKRSGKPVPAPRSVSFEESAAPSPSMTTEQKLVLSPEQTQSLSLKFETIGERPLADAAGQMSTGVVQSNSYKETPVVSLVGGIVRSVKGELGQNLKRGQAVAVVFSNELAETQSRYVAAVAALDEHERHHMRTVKLVEIGAASRQDLETASSQYQEAASNLANLKQKLLLLGMSQQRIDSLKSTSQISSEVTVSSPSSGTITSRTVNVGEVIEANRELMRVTDLSTVWVVGQVYEKDLATVRVGTGANVTSDAYPGRTFHGRVSYVDPKIDTATRTAQVRIELSNPGQILKIGMYVNVAFASMGVTPTRTVVVPKDAVQTIGNQQFVFIPTTNEREFVMRAVRVGPESNGFYPVIEGLGSGDRVVSNGSFMLRAEWTKQHPSS